MGDNEEWLNVHLKLWEKSENIKNSQRITVSSDRIGDKMQNLTKSGAIQIINFSC